LHPWHIGVCADPGQGRSRRHGCCCRVPLLSIYWVT